MEFVKIFIIRIFPSSQVRHYNFQNNAVFYYEIFGTQFLLLVDFFLCIGNYMLLKVNV